MPISSERVVRAVRWSLAITLPVILWGAYVRASGSGAGCGNHWPLCNGTVVPESPTWHTIVELTHRITSNLSLLAVLITWWVARKELPAGHAARRWSVIAIGLMLVEAAIGAGLVKFELVAADESQARAWTLGAHLVNTQFLLAAMALTGWFASGRRAPRRGDPWWPRFVVALTALVLVGLTGAIVSLGDTLFRPDTLAEGWAQHRAPDAHFLVRLRVWHPALAIATGLGLLLLARGAAARRAHDDVQRASRAVMTLVLSQWTLGLATLLLLVPIPLQLLHLLTADLLWLALLLLALATLADDQSGRTTAATS